MRNPLNSIKAENTLKQELTRQLKQLLDRENITIEVLKREAEEIMQRLEYSNDI